MIRVIKLAYLTFFILTVILQSCKKEDDTITDIDGNIYTSVTIGSQVWMKENLSTTMYNDGTPIPVVTDNAVWGNSTTPAYCWYNNDINNKDLYGAIYNWYAVNTGKLCPAGWHVPTEADFTALSAFLGGDLIAGGKLKEAGTLNWEDPNTGASNESGFTALPAGYRGNLGNFNLAGSYTCFWSSTELNASEAWFREVYGWKTNFTHSEDVKEYGFSVRCIMN